MDDVFFEIGQKIRACRRSKGWSMEKLAEETELSVSYIYKIEGGSMHLTVRTLFRIADVLDVSASEILQNDEQTKVDRRLLLWLEKHTDKEIEFIYFMLNQFEHAKEVYLNVT